MIPVRSVALVVNTRSRRGRALFDRACAAFDALGIRHADYAVRDPARLGEAVTAALAARPDALVVGGGDGTISSVVDYLLGSDIPLGLLPIGTANSLARSLGLPLDLDEAINIIAAGHCRRIDLGRIDGDHFANSAAIGLPVRIARSIPGPFKAVGGRWGYALWGLVLLPGFRPFRVEIEGQSFDALEVRIANGSFQGGAETVPEAEVDSGEIVVQLLEGRGRLDLIRHWLTTLTGWPRATRGLREFRGRRFALVADPPQPVSIDGEVLARTPVVAAVTPGALALIAPPPWYLPGDD